MKLKRSRKELNLGKPSMQSTVKEWVTGTPHFPWGKSSLFLKNLFNDKILVVCCSSEFSSLMNKNYTQKSVFPTAEDDLNAAKLAPDTAQTSSPSFSLAFADNEFLLRDELRSVRLQLELLKPDLQQENGIHSTVVIFGSARIPDTDTSVERCTRQKRWHRPIRIILC